MGLIDSPTVLADTVRRHSLTVDDYYRMAQTGVLAPDARVELIEGEIFDLAPIGTRHGSTVKRLLHLLAAAVGDSATIAVQDPVRLSNRSEPQPDLMLLKPRDDFYAEAHPEAADVLLLVEVSDTTARYDRKIKLGLYARHGVCEVWIVDLDNHQMRIYRNPVGEVYTEVQDTAKPGMLSPQALPGVVIDASKLLV
jgi:Uma2 family endonuclease